MSLLPTFNITPTHRITQRRPGGFSIGVGLSLLANAVSLTRDTPCSVRVMSGIPQIEAQQRKTSLKT